MATAVRLYEAGPPEVLRIESTRSQQPGPGEVWLEQEAVGVNYLDVTQRNGQVPIAFPSGLGLEGAGRVAAVGEQVADVAVGDRVAYALGPLGAYASGRLYPAERLIKIPDALEFVDAAAMLFKGLTAQYLIRTTYTVRLGTAVLLYGAAGALGQIIAAWASQLGAVVIGVVSRHTSVVRALQAGCREVLVWGECDIPSEVKQITGGAMVDVVYDGIGQATFDTSIDSLKVRGTIVSIGASSGAPAPVALDLLNRKSLFLTRPGLAAHISDVIEYRTRAREVLSAIDRRIIKPNIWRTAPLLAVAAVHLDLERGSAEGTIVLRP